MTYVRAGLTKSYPIRAACSSEEFFCTRVKRHGSKAGGFAPHAMDIGLHFKKHAEFTTLTESGRKITTLAAMRRFGPYVWRYRGRAMLVILLGLVTGLLLKAPFLLLNTFFNGVIQIKVVTTGAADASPPMLQKVDAVVESIKQQIIEWFPAAGGGGTSDDRFMLSIAIAAAVVLVTVAGALSQLAFVQMSRALSMRILADIRRDLAEHVLMLGMRYHTGSRKGDLISRITTDVNILLVALSLFFDDLILEPAQLIGNFVIALVSNPGLTLLVIAVVPCVAVPLFIFGKKVRKGMRRSLSALGESTETMAQMFTGIRVVKAFRMEEREMKDFSHSNENWIRRYMGVVRAKAMTEALTHILTYGGFALLLCGIAYAQIKYGVASNMGAMGVWLIGFATMYQHIRRISKGYQTVQESMGAAERLFELLDQNPASMAPRKGTTRLQGNVKTVEFRDVSFRYEEETVLDKVSFTIQAGETVAIVGPSGSGKSTLLDLIGRFYEAESGGIFVNNVDIKDLDPEDWFERWALVDQQPFLFHTSIRENVAYGKPSATDDEVRAALKAANLLEYVDSLPAGINTEVGDRGARMSGGQRQRITIARALVKNPQILLLDEVTSALDAESEAAVRDAMDKLMVGRTSFVVAHRLSTIRNATRILVFDRGRIVESGSHEDLLKQGGMYKKLYEMQFGSGG